MEITASIFLILLGTASLFLCVWHENMWLKRKNWKIGTGTIIDYKTNQNTNGVCYPPVIEYKTLNGSSQFVSKYGSQKKPNVGSQTPIIVSEDGEYAEQYNFASRWIFTVIPIPFAFIFISWGIDLLRNSLT